MTKTPWLSCQVLRCSWWSGKMWKGGVQRHSLNLDYPSDVHRSTLVLKKKKRPPNRPNKQWVGEKRICAQRWLRFEARRAHKAKNLDNKESNTMSSKFSISLPTKIWTRIGAERKKPEQKTNQRRWSFLTQAAIPPNQWWIYRAIKFKETPETFQGTITFENLKLIP